MPNKLSDDMYKGLRVLGLESFTVVYDLLEGPTAAAWLAVLNQVTLSAPDRENFAQVIGSSGDQRGAYQLQTSAHVSASAGEYLIPRGSHALHTGSRP